MRYTYHDAEFFQTYKIELLEGRGFLPDTEGNQRESVVLNEAAMKAFGFSDIDNKTILIGDNKINVVGAIKNFNYESLKEEILPILHFHRIPTNAVHQYITLRVNGLNYSETLSFLERKWQIISITDPFDYFFVDDSVNNMYASEDRMLKMVSTFSLVTIFIACLGLFGLSSFMIEKRKREIGIRKVLGASSSQIVLMVSRSFVLLIGIGFVLAIPISGFLMNKWLSNFAYSVEIGPAIYIVSLGLSMLVGWSAVSYKAFEAASVNPTATLKEE